MAVREALRLRGVPPGLARSAYELILGGVAGSEGRAPHRAERGIGRTRIRQTERPAKR